MSPGCSSQQVDTTYADLFLTISRRSRTVHPSRINSMADPTAPSSDSDALNLKVSGIVQLKPQGADSNYLDWSFVVLLHLKSLKLAYVLDPVDTTATDAKDTKSLPASFTNNSIAVSSFIARTIHPSNLRFVRAHGNPREPLDPQETPWSPFIVGSSGFTPDCCKRPLRPLRTLGNRLLASERPPDPRIQLGTALRPSFDELHPPRPLDPDRSSETVWNGPQILGSSSERPSDRPIDSYNPPGHRILFGPASGPSV
ncbi:hypothetical protein PGT21_013400 [Puccinia graminis f. sp. tritici]|uniref:Uncharacterized protein n=1 Tax=Puccinia graminis f. sp. tritici TaxID=56615 RepID=A0A5B0LTH1_PUCGR|nr:hypothetical protein PGT21_013400 [Puccinia graminis f. sp. tritici]